ncbi:MAG: YbjN domain-containing protein [Clostridia bacterium]|nr:YbjN domain-containing protein [Clostridia bacterium]
MADARQLKKAQEVYQTLCDALEARQWSYDKDTENPEKLYVRFTVNGEDIPMRLTLFVDANRELVRLMSFMPFNIPEDKREILAIATCEANYKMADGGFDMDLDDGAILFRMNASYRSSLVSESMMQYMISCTCSTVDRYNDLFLMLGKGAITLSQFMQTIGA